MWGRAIVLVLVAAGCGLLVYMIAAPRLLDRSDPQSALPPAARTPASIETPDSSQVPASPRAAASRSFTPNRRTSLPIPSPPSSALDPPRSEAQQRLEDLELLRAGFYSRLRAYAGTLLHHTQPSTADPATLEIYATGDDERMLADLLRDVTAADAYRAGFRHILFYFPDRAETPGRFRLEAEAVPDNPGSWRAFRK